jgi:hypothetical protein
MKMENVFYLLNMSISGIKSIKKKIRLDFYKKTVDKDFDPDKYRIKAIYGENGSGKSAVVTAVKIFQDLVINDNYLSESKTQAFLDEIINKSAKRFHFECEFLVNVNMSKIIYSYSIDIGKNDNKVYEIQSEELKMKNGNYANNNYKKIYESKNGELVFINCSENEKEILEKNQLIFYHLIPLSIFL